MKQSNVYLCVDVEASGPVPAIFDLVSVGGVAVRTREDGDGHEILEDEPFYEELLPQGGRLDPGAMKVHGLTSEHLQEHGRPRDEVVRELTRWAKARRRKRSDRLVFVGHNAPFDWAWINHAYQASGVSNPFGWKALDTKALAMGVLDLDWFDTNKEILAERLPEIGQQDVSRTHRADYDALYQARILKALLDHPRREARS